jgi:HEAT repeat protein
MWLTLLLAFALTACVRGERSPCPKYVRDLESPVKAKDALREIGEQKCKMAIPSLMKMFDEDKYRDDVIRTTKAIGWYPAVVQGKVNKTEEEWAGKAVEILRKGLTDRVTASLASSVIQDWRIAEAKGDLIKLLMNDEFIGSRNQALQALIAVVSPDKGTIQDTINGLKGIEDVLLKLLDGDPNKQNMYVNVLAAQSLGLIRSAKAIDPLINSMFLRTLKDEKMYQVARRALLQIGMPALDRLIATMKGQNTGLVEYCKANGILEWEWKDGPELSQMLGDFGDPKVGPALIEKQGEALYLPPGLSEKQMEFWKMAQSNRIKITMLALTLVGTDEIVPKALEILANTDNDIQQRLDTATALGVMGTTAAVDGLISFYKQEKDERVRAPLLMPIVLGLDWAHYADFDKVLKADKSEIVKAYLDQDPTAVKDMLALVNECQDKLDCWKTKLEMLDPVVAQKSALAIRQLGDKSKPVLDGLVKRFTKTKPGESDARRFILSALLRLGAGDEYVFSKLIELWRGEETSGTGLNKFWAAELEMVVLGWEARYGFKAENLTESQIQKTKVFLGGEAAKPAAGEAKPAAAAPEAAKPAEPPAAAPEAAKPAEPPAAAPEAAKPAEPAK